jgi:hypothetical protein
MKMTKVKMRNAEVIGLAECLNSMTKEGVNLKPRTWFTLSANRKNLIEIGQTIDESNKAIDDKYKSTDDEGKTIIPEDKIEKWQSDKTEILSIEVEVELTKLSLSAIEKEMPKLKGISNLFLFFDHLIEDDTVKKSKKK